MRIVPSVPLSAEAGHNLTISNLNGAIVSGTDVPIEVRSPSLSAELFQTLSGTINHGTWKDDSKSLNLNLYCRLEPGITYEFCFTVTNPNMYQTSADVRIVAKEGGDSVLMKTNADVATAPMYVKKGSFTKFSATTNKLNPCDMNNEVTISFAIDIDVVCDPAITISGLQGTKLLSNLTLDQSFTAVTEIQSGSTLVFKWGHNMSLGEHTVKFTIENNNNATTHPVQMNIEHFAMRSAVSSFSVKAPAISGYSVTQQTRWPGVQTLLNVKFMINADQYSQSNNGAITLSGLPLSWFGAFLIGARKKGIECAIPPFPNVTVPPSMLSSNSSNSTNSSNTTESAASSNTTSSNSNTSHTYILYTKQMVSSRFPNINGNNAEHLACVRYSFDESTWQYWGSSSWHAFDRSASDVEFIAFVVHPGGNTSAIANTSAMDAPSQFMGIDVGISVSDSDVSVKPVKPGSSLSRCASALDLEVEGDFLKPSAFRLKTSSHPMTATGQDTSIVLHPQATLPMDAQISVDFYMVNPTTADSRSIRLNGNSGCAVLPSVNIGFSVFDSPAVLTAKAVQTSPFPCSVNTIAVLFSTNFHVRGMIANSITLSSAMFIPIIQMAYDLIESEDDGNLYHHVVGPIATLSSDTFTLSVANGHNLIAGVEYQFSFN
eukprot:424616-Hanusia_phi.AAC.1